LHLKEKIIEFNTENPVEIFGINNVNINILKQSFPKIKIIARGNLLKVLGQENEVESFENIIEQLTNFYLNFNKLTEEDVRTIISGEKPNLSSKSNQNGAGQKSNPTDKIILYGSDGEPIKARSVNQLDMVESIDKFDMLFAIGPAGTGKTYTSVALAVNALKNKEVKRIILTRPAVEAGENLGFLPGDLKDKLDPYLQPLYDALRDMIPSERLSNYLEKGIIQIAPLAFMRGRTLDHAFVILDEAQNATQSQLKMFLTRMGRSAKFIITGDMTQIDLPKNQPSGLVQAANFLKDVAEIKFIFLDERDILRHNLVKKIIAQYDRNESKS